MTLMSPKRFVTTRWSGFPRHLVEEHGAAAVEVLLEAGDLEVGIDLTVGLDQVTLQLEPLEGRAKIGDRPCRLVRTKWRGGAHCVPLCRLAGRP